METGVVKWFNDVKGFGTIIDEFGRELHFTKVQVVGFQALTENQKVQFEVKTGPNGLEAGNIRPIKDE